MTHARPARAFVPRSLTPRLLPASTDARAADFATDLLRLIREKTS